MNPYNPQGPTVPEVFAGRAPLVEQANESIAAARKLGRGAAFLLHGHRGSGKTSALRKIESVVRQELPESVVVEIPLRARSDDDQLARMILDQLKGAIAGRASLWAKVKSGFEQLAEVAVAAGPPSVRAQKAGGSASSSALALWQGAVALLSDCSLICLCIDDAESLDKPGLGMLKTIAEMHGKVPVLLAVAGSPDLLKVLSEPDSSPIARIFSGAMFDMGAFTLEETREALEAPLRTAESTTRWTTDAARVVRSLSHGYPYLVQCMAKAAYRDVPEITAEMVHAAVPETLRIGAPWLDREISKASDVDVITFYKIAQTGRTSLTSAEILKLGVQSPYIGRLVSLGVLTKTAPGHYELKKAPVIAYYHLLKRHLSIS